MTRIGLTLVVAFLVLVMLGAPRHASAQEFGTLVFNLKNYSTDVKIPTNVQKSLKHSGIKWGMANHTVIISLVSEKFVNADINNLTRFGEQKTLQLKPGQYTITCIAYELDSNSRDIDKVLSKNAFFNEDALAFTVLPGKTTTLEVFPLYETESHRRLLTKLTFYIPNLNVKIWEDGTEKGENVINLRTDKSISWDDYHGPLKF